jgi:hypothetical protein
VQPCSGRSIVGFRAGGALIVQRRVSADLHSRAARTACALTPANRRAPRDSKPQMAHDLGRTVRGHLREDGIEIQAHDEGPTTPHADLLEYVLEVFLDGVLGDVESSRDLPGRGAAHHELDQLPLTGTQAVGSGVQPRHLF